MATTIDPRRLRDRPGGLAPNGTGPAGADHADGHERARAFASARRHSIMVRALRLSLPLLAVGMLGIYGATTWRIATLRSAGVTLEEVRISNDLLVMANPKYAGTGKDGSRHAVRARSAETDLLTQKLVKLTTIEGEITQVSGTRVDLTATRGTYDQETGVLELLEQIDVRSTDGMTAKLTAATVMTKENQIVSNEPITATTATSSIRARGMEMATQRRIATFTGDVAVRMTPPPAAEGATPKKEKSPSTSLGPSFSSNEPVDVTSDRLVVDDGKHTAMFRTNVIARQGTATLAAPELDAIYAGRSALPGAPARESGADPAASRLTKLDARGGVVMTRDADRATATALHHDTEVQRTTLTGPVDMTSGIDRRATSTMAEIDHKADRITLDGAVVLYQGRNILRGERLAIDRANGRARLDSPLESARGNGRINVILYRTEQPASRARAPAPTAEASEGNGVVGAFRTDPNQPIDIDATALDFDEARRNAHFTGNVVAKQGEFVIRTPSLTAYFQGQTSLLAAAPKGSDAAGAASLKKIEARNGVVITGKDGQKVTGDSADFDPAANFATVSGRVIVHQGKNVVEGSKLIMDLTSGRTRFETGGAQATAVQPTPESTVPCVAGQTCTSRPRVRAVFYPKDAKRPPAVRNAPTTGSTSPSPPDQPSAPPRGTGQSSWQSSTTRPPEPGASQ
jgi:lipopolysaccharide transport protein LptA/LPS export ABC transporter protein LptC